MNYSSFLIGMGVISKDTCSVHLVAGCCCCCCSHFGRALPVIHLGDVAKEQVVVRHNLIATVGVVGCRVCLNADESMRSDFNL